MTSELGFIVSLISFFILLMYATWRARVPRLGGVCLLLLGLLGFFGTIITNLLLGHSSEDLLTLSKNTTPGFPVRVGLSLAAILVGIFLISMNRKPK